MSGHRDEIPLVIIRNTGFVNDYFAHAMKSDTGFIPRAKAIKVNWFLHLEHDYVSSDAKKKFSVFSTRSYTNRSAQITEEG